MNDRIETIILQHLIADPTFARQVLPHMKPELFRERTEAALFSVVSEYVTKYQASPTFEQLFLALEKYPLSQQDFDLLVDHMKSQTFREFRARHHQWLLDETEKFIQRQQMHNAVVDLINALDEKKPITPSLDAIRDAEAFAFNTSVGHDPISDWEAVYDARLSEHEQFPFELYAFKERIGGVRRKTQNVILASTSVGKSLTLIHLAGDYLRQGKTLVYFTLELDQKIISERIHANLLNVDMETISEKWDRVKRQQEMEQIKSALKGKMIVQEYPSRTAHVGHFKAFLDELKRKQNITPDVIMVDYLNLCSSRTMRAANNVNRYQVVGSISNELRALAQQTNTVLWTATQTNRNGYKGDADMQNTSESYEINSACDLLLGISKDESDPGALKFRVLKNRNGVLNDMPFSVPVKPTRMRLYDADNLERTNEAMKMAMNYCHQRKEGQRSEKINLGIAR